MKLNASPSESRAGLQPQRAGEARRASADQPRAVPPQYAGESRKTRRGARSGAGDRASILAMGLRRSAGSPIASLQRDGRGDAGRAPRRRRARQADEAEQRHADERQRVQQGTP